VTHAYLHNSSTGSTCDGVGGLSDDQTTAGAVPRELRKERTSAENLELTMVATLAVLWDVSADASADAIDKVKTEFGDMLAQTSSPITVERGIQAQLCGRLDLFVLRFVLTL